jgi:Ca-activated chloride channel family protein
VKYLPWLIMAAILLSLTACGDSAARYNNRGNDNFEAAEYEAALENYTTARLEEPDLAEPYYNSGNTLYRQGELDRAGLQLQQAVKRAKEGTAPQANFNLGNTFFQQQNWPEAIEAFKQSLRLNPGDWDAKHNLELALRQQQQQQGGGSQGDQPQPNQNDQQGDQPQQGQQNQNEQGQGQQQPNESQGSGGQNEQQNQQPSSGRNELTPDEAEQLLDALGQNSQTLQERLGERFQAQNPPPTNDW